MCEKQRVPYRPYIRTKITCAAQTEQSDGW